MTRDEIILSGLTREMCGIEIGPFYSPIASKRDGWNIVIVDFADADHLTAVANTHSSEYIRDRAHLIEHVDIIWDGSKLDDRCLSLNPEGYDYIVVSHVLEHFPDVISFFQQAERILKPDGVFTFAFPDMRACFDLFRTPTFTPNLVQAHKEKRRLHAPQTLLEAYLYNVQGDNAGSWLRGQAKDIKISDHTDHAYSKYEAYSAAAENGTQAYVDTHAWVATPSSFELVMVELNDLSLSTFYVDEMVTTIGADFYVKMRKQANRYDKNTLNEMRVDLLRKHRRELVDC